MRLTQMQPFVLEAREASGLTVQPREAKPLLTIAIPTFSRAETLRGALTALEPQVAQFPMVEVFVSDNCSDDGTPAVIEEFRLRFKALGCTLRSQRHAENIGSDANFASAYHAARGS